MTQFPESSLASDYSWRSPHMTDSENKAAKKTDDIKFNKTCRLQVVSGVLQQLTWTPIQGTKNVSWSLLFTVLVRTVVFVVCSRLSGKQEVCTGVSVGHALSGTPSETCRSGRRGFFSVPPCRLVPTGEHSSSRNASKRAEICFKKVLNSFIFGFISFLRLICSEGFGPAGGRAAFYRNPNRQEE